MGSLFTNLVQKVVISRKWIENGPMLDREWTDEVAEKSVRMSTVWAMIRVKLVNFANFVMQIFKWTKWTKWTEQIFDESAESAKSARSIFATFATFASANFVGKASCESTVRYREWSRIPSCYLRLASVFTLICFLGIGEVWGATETSTFTSKYLAVGDGEPAWTGSTGSNSDDSEFGVSGRGVQYSAANGTTKTFTSTAFRNKLIKSVSAVVSRNKANYPVSISVTVNSNTLGSGDTSGDQPNNETITTSDDVGIACSTGDVVVSISTGGPSSSAKSLYVKSISVTYSDGCVSTLTTPVVTATPTSGQVVLTWPDVANATKYQLKWDGGSWTDAVSGVTKTSLTNGTEYTYQVKAIGNGSTICDSDPTESAKVIPGTYYTVTFMNNGETYATKSILSGTNLILPDNPSTCMVGKEFVGWSTTNIGSTPTNTKPTFVSTQTTISSARTLYAVFATKTANSYSVGNVHDLIEGQKVLIVNTNSSYAMSNSGSSGKLAATSVSISSNKISSPASSLIWTIEHDGAKYKFKNTYYVYASSAARNKLWCDDEDGDYPDSWTISDAGSSYYYLTSDRSTSSYKLEYYSSNFTTYDANTTNPYKMQFFVPTYTAYITSCCTALGSVTGNIGTNTPTSVTLTWSAVSGAEKYQVKVPGSSSHNDWTDAVSGVSVTKSCGTAYTAYFRAIDTNGSHCAEGPESTLAIPAVSWTVTSTVVTNATASPAIPSTTCSGFSTTISPATGYALPADITVTNATKSWNSSTGALSISSVTGNVSITITPTCVPPVISGDPADASYYVGDSPDALSVSATLASGTLTYLWKVSTNGGSTWSDATGTNNAATYSGASLSTASAGTLKFKCIVGNSQGGCTVESGVATITVAEPSSWKFKYSGDEWIEHTMIEDAGEVSYSISLAADSRFEFGFDGGSFYKNNGTIITTTSGWVFNTTDNNCHIHTGPAGIYTFTINTSTKAVTVTYPTVSHPNEHYVYFKNTNVWGTVYGYLANSENDNKAAAWPGSVMQPTTSICGETYHYAALNAMSGTYNTIIFNNGSDGYGNQTSDLSTTGSLGKYNANQDDSWHQFKYAINFDKGTGSGDAMVSIENLCLGSNQALTANTYTKEHNTFAGWIADVDVKVGESTIDAGEIIDDEVTIKDIQSDINLTAQWTPDTYTITKTLTNVANAGLPSSFTYTGATTTALNSTFTVDATNFFLPSSIAVTMGGTPLTAGTDYTYNNSTGAFTFSAVITGDIDITATATAKLKSIAITTLPTARKYFEGESFSSTGAVVTATMGDGSTKTVSVTWDLTTLTAGAGQTVTASYSEGGIDQTATTTIDVYSVTVNKVNEDGDAISADGVTATWTVGSKTIAASATSASKYVFKQWDVTGATAASTSSASTTLSSPTANVVVNAIFYKPRVVKWSVNGNDSYNTGGPTTTVAYNGTISTVPTDPSGLACASTFVAWTDAAHNNGQTAKDNASYYGSALYTDAVDFPNITAETTTFYAVFAEGTGAEVNTVMWGETWTDATVSNGSSGQSDANPDDNCSTTKGTTIYGTASISYTQSDNSNVYCRNENSAGGTAPELYIKSSKSWTISGIPTGGAATLSLTYATNKTPTVTVSTTELGKTPTISGANKDKTITTDGASTITIQFSTSENTRVDNVELKVATVSLTNYVTECDANIVSVTYDANGGATSCTNTTTDKTEDFTVCSSAPTRDYYTFAGWLCSADDKVYAANATISATAIDADFTLTAQWTPVPYTITYNYNGGSAQVDPVPATSYTVESSAITLQTPTKGHDRFDGWYENADLSTGGVKTTIAAGSHENKTYYAKWTARHEIVFDADGATTTIYRADDEALNASVAGQGSIPANPSAPSACSSKEFVGWVAEEIDGETDDEPTFLDVTSKVNADKHYYAVWATSVGTPIDAVEDNSFTGSGCESYMSSSYGMKEAGDYIIKNSIWTSSNMTDVKVRIRVKHVSNNGAETLRVSLVNSSDVEVDGADLITTAFGTNSTPAAYSSYVELTPTSSVTGYKVAVKTKGKSVYGTSVYAVTREVVPTRSAYSTSCCATKVTLTQNDPEHGTVTFNKTTQATCGGDKEVTMTITPAAGYQLSSYAVATGDGKVAAKSMSAEVVTNNNSSAAQNITLTFDEDANGAYDVTAAFSEMCATAWTWTTHDGGEEVTTEPLEVYVGQQIRIDVTYSPAGLLSSHTNNTAYNYSPYPWSNSNLGSPSRAGAYFTVTGTNAGSTSVVLNHNDGLTKTIYYTVKALPLVHFTDNVHNVVFADVAGTLEANALVKDKTTPTTSDFSGTTYNSCEEKHEHLVGWIESSWADENPNATHSEIAGAGPGVFYTAGASIDVDAQNGKTFYAVWSKIE
jgi:uncharacterized repeat protein (TIGR02543 family)